MSKRFAIQYEAGASCWCGHPKHPAPDSEAVRLLDDLEKAASVMLDAEAYLSANEMRLNGACIAARAYLDTMKEKG